MKRRHVGLHSGFTLVEVMVTVALIGIIVAAGFGFNFFVDSYRLGRDTFLYVYVYGDMERKAMLGLEEMIHGRENHKGIQEAQSVDTSVSSEITFVSKGDSVSRKFEKSDSKIVHTNLSTSVSTDIIDSDVQTLTFTEQQDDLLEITLGLQKTALGRTVTINLTTSVNLRNK